MLLWWLGFLAQRKIDIKRWIAMFFLSLPRIRLFRGYLRAGKRATGGDFKG
jgi:hypothetical protein